MGYKLKKADKEHHLNTEAARCHCMRHYQLEILNNVGSTCEDNSSPGVQEGLGTRLCLDFEGDMFWHLRNPKNFMDTNRAWLEAVQITEVRLYYALEVPCGGSNFL